jgi:hypothetical protein
LDGAHGVDLQNGNTGPWNTPRVLYDRCRDYSLDRFSDEDAVRRHLTLLRPRDPDVPAPNELNDPRKGIAPVPIGYGDRI